LVVEYEDVTKRLVDELLYTERDIDVLLNYLCRVANRWKICYLWRPFLKDPKDEMILELAFTANCDFIVTHNKRDFEGVAQFGIQAVTPQEFLREIGEIL
jgi:predicted nucleic acid-binding protein